MDWHQDQTPTAQEGKRRGSRWDETPVDLSGSATPLAGGATPVGNMGQMTPSFVPMTPEQIHARRWEKDIDERNRPMTDEELDSMFPTEGYVILEPPSNYQPPARKYLTTPTPMANAGFQMQEEGTRLDYGITASNSSLPELKPEDEIYFKKIMVDVDESQLSAEEQRERKIMRLLLKVKNGTPPQRKLALRQLTDKAREFGAGALFNQILPLLMSPTLEDQERHLLVKVIDRILYKLDDLVRPFVHKILVVIGILLLLLQQQLPSSTTDA
jgi:splicing factor 3B subunit 1